MSCVKLKWCLLSGLALLPGLSALAGGSDGGANSINYKLIESYSKVTELQELCGYADFRKKLDELKAQFPSLGEALEENVSGHEWYMVPADIPELSEDRTNLHFSTQQPGVQPPNGHEVFLSTKIFGGICDGDPKEAGRTIMHEALMTLEGDKLSDPVRGVMAKLYADKPDPRDIQNALAKYGFGVYFTADQVQLQKRIARQDYLQALSYITQQVGKDCDQNESLDHIQMDLAAPDYRLINRRSVAKSLARRRDYKNESDYELLIADVGTLDDQDTPVLDAATFTSSSPKDSSPWYSPFREGWDNRDGMVRSNDNMPRLANDVVEQSCKEHSEMFGVVACKEFMDHEVEGDTEIGFKLFTRLGRPDLMPKFGAVSAFDKRTESDRRTAALVSAYQSLGHEQLDYQDFLAIKEKLAGSAAFLNLAAVELVHDFTNPDKDSERHAWAADLADKGPMGRAAKIMAKVFQARDNLPLANKASLKRLVCSSASFVSHDLDRLIQAENGTAVPAPAETPAPNGPAGEGAPAHDAL